MYQGINEWKFLKKKGNLHQDAMENMSFRCPVNSFISTFVKNPPSPIERIKIDLTTKNNLSESIGNNSKK